MDRAEKERAERDAQIQLERIYTKSRDRQLQNLVDGVREIPKIRSTEEILSNQAEANSAAIKVLRDRFFEREANRFYNYLMTHDDINKFLELQGEFFDSIKGLTVASINTITQRWEDFKVKVSRAAQEEAEAEAPEAEAEVPEVEEDESKLADPTPGVKYFSEGSIRYPNPLDAVPSPEFFTDLVNTIMKIARLSSAALRIAFMDTLNEYYKGDIPMKVKYVQGGVGNKVIGSQSVLDVKGDLANLGNKNMMETIIYYLFGVTLPFNLKLIKQGQEIPSEWLFENDETEYDYVFQQLKSVGDASIPLMSPLMSPVKKSTQRVRQRRSSVSSSGQMGQGLQGAGPSLDDIELFTHLKTLDFQPPPAKVNTESKFIKYGAFFINLHKLNNRILEIVDKYRHKVPRTERLIVSEALKLVLLKMLQGFQPTKEEMDTLTEKDVDILQKVYKICKLDKSGVNLYNVLDKSKEEMNRKIDRFNVLRGQVLAGNNNKRLFKEMKQLLIYLKNKEMIDRNIYNRTMEDLLMTMDLD